jgi:hypothetical protein
MPDVPQFQAPERRVHHVGTGYPFLCCAIGTPRVGCRGIEPQPMTKHAAAHRRPQLLMGRQSAAARHAGTIFQHSGESPCAGSVVLSFEVRPAAERGALPEPDFVLQRSSR